MRCRTEPERAPLAAPPQLAGGVRAIQVREVEVAGQVTACFFLLHDDGSDEDVSYRKVGAAQAGCWGVCCSGC